MLFASVSCFQSLGSLVHFSCSYVVGNLQYVLAGFVYVNVYVNVNTNTYKYV